MALATCAGEARGISSGQVSLQALVGDYFDSAAIFEQHCQPELQKIGLALPHVSDPTEWQNQTSQQSLKQLAMQIMLKNR